MNALPFTLIVMSASAGGTSPPVDVNLLGEWGIESVTSNGRPRTDSVGTKYVFRRNGRWETVIPSRGGKPARHITHEYELKPADPLFIDLNPPGLGGSFGRKRIAIYKVEGDTLLLCERRRTGRPPDKFEAPEGSKATLYTLQRPKPKPVVLTPLRIGLGGVGGSAGPLVTLWSYEGKGIVGEWLLESVNHGGEDCEYWPEKKVYRLTSDGYWFRDGAYPCEAVCDPNAKPPTIDIILRRQDKPPFMRERLLGIYTVEGGTLVICFGRADGDRPTAFKSQKRNGFELFTLRRVKKEDK